ncbi:MAG: hypothetical protein AABX37_00535 [Nanoarchaeota archaeon]
MGEAPTYSTASIDVVVDVLVEVRRTTPEAADAYEAELKKYGVLQDTDIVVPEGLRPFGMFIRPEPLNDVTGRLKPGENYQAWLMRPVVSVGDLRQKEGKDQLPFVNDYFFPGRDLELRIGQAREQFAADLESMGLSVDPSAIYLRLRAEEIVYPQYHR